MNTFARVQSAPVLTKGGTYDGWAADALAAPAACWNGTAWVMTVSLWSVANGKWASAFFTGSTDLTTWTYVSGSLRSPTTGNYILGNGGIARFNGKYYFAYSQFAVSPASGSPTYVESSTDLLTWTAEATIAGSWDDPQLAVNPTSGLLELWAVNDAAFASRTSRMWDSPDGTTWTSRGAFHTPSFYNSTNYGEPAPFYYGGARYLMFDACVEAGRRAMGLAVSAGQNTTWDEQGSVLGPDPFNAWEAVNCFDSCPVGLYDRGDGLGPVFWALYAGSDIVSSTDATNSSIGLAYMALPDTTAPTLTAPAGTATGTTTATTGATTDEANGTLYVVVTASGSAPTAAQVEAGLDAAGGAAAFAGSLSVSTTGAKTIGATGLSSSTAYYAHLTHEDASGNRSSVVSSAQFATRTPGTVMLLGVGA